MMTIKLSEHFTADEFKCHCNRPQCNAVPMDPLFIAWLEQLRIKFDKPLFPTSGERCSYWNAHVGGKVGSYHLKGRASDFFFDDKTDKEKFIADAEGLKVGGMGISKNGGLVHVDNRTIKTRWFYD